MKTLLAVAFCFTAPAAVAQFVSNSSSFSMDKDGNFTGTMNFQPTGFLPFAVPGAPYSAEDKTEREQVLANGTRIRNTMTTRKVWRDSQGRARSERPVMMNPNREMPSPAVIEICDPVEGAVYVLDEQAQVAHRVKMNVVNARPGAGGPPFRNQPDTEALGTQVMEGVVVEGYRHTSTIPEGKAGNDRPIAMTTEAWYSNDLKLVVLSITNDPRYGTNKTMVTNISRAEPDPALFRVPPGYTVVDETAPFTIKFSGKR